MNLKTFMIYNRGIGVHSFPIGDKFFNLPLVPDLNGNF